jgi:hypothetical protein
MSGRHDSFSREDPNFASRREAHHHGGEHDEVFHGAIASSPLPEDEGEMEITTGQKMLSAMSGSLFTSLLGISRSFILISLRLANILF